MKFRLFHVVVAVVMTAITVTQTQVPVVHAEVPAPFDSTFGTNGIATFNIPLQKSESEVIDVVNDSNGNHYALIVATSGETNDIVTIRKYSAPGLVISSFGTNGQSDNIRLSGPSIALQTDGKIVVSGFQYSNNQTKLAVYRFNTNGRIDTSFGTNGAYIIPSFPGINIWSPILLLAIDQSTGRIHIAFNVSNIQDTDQNFYFIALDVDGQLDYNWSNGGAEEVVPRTGPVSAYSTLTNIQILSDGSLLGIGSAFSSSGVRAIVLIKLNQYGYLDQSFDGSSNGNGVVFIPFGSESEAYMTAAVVLQDDSVVLAGNAGTYNSGPWYYGVTKILSNGTVDITFGANGFKLSALQTDFSTTLPRRIGIQTDGRYVFPINSGTTAGFMRVETNGTFSNSPNCSQCLWSGANDGVSANSLVVQSDDKIVVVGQHRTEKNFIIRRFTASGLSDDSFSASNIQITAEKWSSSLNYIDPQADGSILGIGGASTFSRFADVNRTAVYKFNADGSPDNSFGLGGFQLLAAPDDLGWVDAIDLITQLDGKILILANGRSYSNYQMLMWRLNANGSLDNSFGVNGLAVTSETSIDIFPSGFVINSDGKILVALSKYENNETSPWMYQFTSSGALDTSFSDTNNFPGGKKPLIGDGTGYPSFVFAASNGKFYVSGSTSVNSNPSSYLARFLSDGTLDPAFSGGYVTWDVQTAYSMNEVLSVHEDVNNNIFVAGSTTNPQSTGLVIQLNSDGSQSNSFNGNGHKVLEFRDPTQIENSMAYGIVMHGNILTVIGGGDSNPAQYQWANFSTVARMTSDGVLDTNFGTNGIVDPFPTNESYFSDIAPLENGASLIVGYMKEGDSAQIIMMKLGPSVSVPSSTTPPTTSPPSTTTPPTSTISTTTTMPQTTITSNEPIKLVISVSKSAVIKRLKLSVPKGAKVTITSKTKKVCRVTKTKVIASSTGTCRVTVTVTDKKKKKKVKTLAIKVS